MMSKLLVLLLALGSFAALALAGDSKVPPKDATAGAVRWNNMEWIDCETFIDYFDTLARATNIRPLKSRKGYNALVCKEIFEHYKSSPVTVDALVNLANHVDKKLDGDARRLRNKDKVEDIASNLRGTHAKQELSRMIYKDKTPADFERRLQTVGEDFLEFDTDNSDATEISLVCEPVGTDECPHAPCVPAYLFNDSEDTFYEFIPAYGGGLGYGLGTALLADPLLTLLGPFKAAFGSIFGAASGFDIEIDNFLWTGVDADRTDTGNIGFLLVLLFAQGTAETIQGVVCDVSPDDIEVPLVCVDLPNPLKVVCEAIEGFLKITGQILGVLKEQADFQDSLVDGAEVEAAYEISRNLLQKSCAIYDAAVCRCQDADAAGTYGLGCDGLDSDCDDVIDECDEDTVLPSLDVTAALAKCSDTWFLTEAEAQQCVEDTIVASDDCQTTTETFATVNECGESTVTVNTTDACGNGPVTVVIPVKIDIEPPTVSCSFAQMNVTTTGPSVLEDLGFTYSASDNCGKEPLNVTATIYSSEIEDFNSQKLALFYRVSSTDPQARLYLAKGICSTSSNGQCINDPKAINARKYTAVVTATDPSGQTSEVECSVSILPQDNGNGKNKGNTGGTDTSLSTQRFFLTSFSSVF